MSMGIGLVELVVLAAAAAGIFALVRKASWKTLIAVPLGILLLLGAASIFWALAARSVVHTEVWTQPATWSPSPQWTYDNPHVTIESAPWNKGASVGTLLLELLVFLSLPILATVVYMSRKWIARNANVLVPLGVVAALGLAFVAVPVALYLPMRMQAAEEVRRATSVENLRAMGEAMHRSEPRVAVIPEDLVPPPQPLVVEAVDVPKIDDLTIHEPATETIEAVEATEGTPAETPPVIAELPEWARVSSDVPADLSAGPTVLRSDEWSSVEESELQLEKVAQTLIARRFRQEHPELSGWQPPVDIIHQCGAITQRYVEQTSLKVGEFESPMYRTYWRLDYNAALADRAYAAAKNLAVQHRLSALGIGVIALTLLFGLVAAA
ncbi:MAG: hypothetical protein JNG89_14645, partial [Planctomycetaceae bacterium]|nr:hypothetical protein [Planctomycetaceae bacterium]